MIYLAARFLARILFSIFLFGANYSMKLSSAMKRLAVVATGAALAVSGSIEAAHAFTFSEVPNPQQPPPANPLNVDPANNTLGTAQFVGNAEYNVNNVIDGAFQEGDTNDFFRFLVPNPGALGGGLLSFRTRIINQSGVGTTAPGPSAPLLELLNTGGTVLASSTPFGSAFTQLLAIPELSPNTSYILRVYRTAGTAFTPYEVEGNFDPVPEPFTMLGSAAAIGVGGMMQRKRKQRQLAAQKAE